MRCRCQLGLFYLFNSWRRFCRLCDYEMAKISSRTYLKFMRFFRPIEYYLVVVDRLRSYHLVVQVDFCVFLELFRVGLIWSQAMGHQCRVMLICSQAMGTPMIYLLMTLKLKHMLNKLLNIVLPPETK